MTRPATMTEWCKLVSRGKERFAKKEMTPPAFPTQNDAWTQKSLSTRRKCFSKRVQLPLDSWMAKMLAPRSCFLRSLIFLFIFWKSKQRRDRAFQVPIAKESRPPGSRGSKVLKCPLDFILRAQELFHKLLQDCCLIDFEFDDSRTVPQNVRFLNCV